MNSKERPIHAVRLVMVEMVERVQLVWVLQNSKGTYHASNMLASQVATVVYAELVVGSTTCAFRYAYDKKDQALAACHQQKA